METKMTPRQIRQEIDAIDQQLHQLEPWERQLTTARNRYVLRSESSVIGLIDNGKRGGEGRPDDPDLEPFDRRMPGLVETRAQIARLRERKALLVQHLPTEAQRAATRAELEQRAASLASALGTLESDAAQLSDRIAGLGSIAVSVAQTARELWEVRFNLQRAAEAADVEMPTIPDVAMPKVPLAYLLGTMLQRHYSAPQPYPVESVFAALVAAPAEAK